MTTQTDFIGLCHTHHFPEPSAAQFEKLEAYAALLQKWNKRINLIGQSTATDIWDRHIVDSYQMVPLIQNALSNKVLENTPYSKEGDVNGHLLDIGSGGGMPAVIIAIMCPNLHVSACEINGKKATFLNTVRRELGLQNFTVIHGDVQNITHQRFNIISARAFATISDIFTLTKLNTDTPFLAENGCYILPKGATYAEEWAEMQHNFPTLNMTKNITSSITDSRGRILTISANL